MKNLTSVYVVCLLGMASAMQSANVESASYIKQANQERIELLHKYQLELHALKTKVSQLETEVFTGGYNDLIERYQAIIQQLEHDIKRIKPYTYLRSKLQVQQSEIDDLKSSISSNNFFLFISMLFSMIAVVRVTN